MNRVLNESDFKVAPCLREGPIAQRARAFVQAALDLGSTGPASVLRAWCVPYAFNRLEDVFRLGAEPIAALNAALACLSEFLETAMVCDVGRWIAPGSNVSPETDAGTASVEETTGEHYGRLFESFSEESFSEEPTRLLRQRLERNRIAISDVAGKELLDAGCGGGRYTVAWKKLGVNAAVGVDVSATGVADARQRVQQAGTAEVRFEVGNVLDLPFSRDQFDIVFSNGVLHHTIDWRKGVGELVRVLKPGGVGWLYLIEKPGGLFWDTIEILRAVMRQERPAMARNALRLLGIPANRIFYMLDHVMVPINIRLTPQEIEDCLQDAGATQIRRLKRGADFDRVEQIHLRKAFAEVHFGVGENRYVFSKG